MSLYRHFGVASGVILICREGGNFGVLAFALIIALNIWNVILMTNFFKEMPSEIEEAAFIDGASHWQNLWFVVLPMSVPVIAALSLFTAVGHWNAWFDGMILMSDP